MYDLLTDVFRAGVGISFFVVASMFLLPCIKIKKDRNDNPEITRMMDALASSAFVVGLAIIIAAIFA